MHPFAIGEANPLAVRTAGRISMKSAIADDDESDPVEVD
jgi:hypothetical protein